MRTLRRAVNGWILSPAYDLNPSVEKDGLALNIDMDDNSLDLEVAKSVGIYFRLNESEMDSIILEVQDAVCNWQNIASEIGISRGEQELMNILEVQDAVCNWQNIASEIGISRGEQELMKGAFRYW